MTKLRKYNSLKEALSGVKEKHVLIEQINTGDIKKVVSPQIHSMVLHQSLNQRIVKEYSSAERGSSAVRRLRAHINEISQEIINSNDWKVVDKFQAFSSELVKMMDENANISEVEEKILIFKRTFDN